MERSREEVERLIKENRRLVKQTARKYFPQKSRDEDLIQCGLIGLWEAAKGWDTEKSKFSTYAIHCIHHNMIDYVRSEGRAPIPVDQQKEDATDDEPDTIDRLDLLHRIEESWPANSRERYILIALSGGQSMIAVALALGVSAHTAKGIAEKAMAGLKKEDGN